MNINMDKKDTNFLRYETNKIVKFPVLGLAKKG